MISNLNPGLSQRVVRAVHNRLRQALNMPAVPETATAVPESGAAVPETGAAVPETEEANADAPGIAHSPTHGDGERERSRLPRAGVPLAETEAEKTKELKAQVVQELLTSLLKICPLVTAEEATPEKMLQSNLPLRVAMVGLTARLSTIILELQKTQECLKELGTTLFQTNLELGKTLKDQGVAIESLAGGVSHNTSKIGAFKGELKLLKDWIKWALSGNKPQGEYVQEVVAAVQAMHEGLVPVLNANNEVLDKQMDSLHSV